MQKAKSGWRCMSERQKQRARDACFRILKPTEQSQSADVDLTVTYRAAAGKKNEPAKARTVRAHELVAAG